MLYNRIFLIILLFFIGLISLKSQTDFQNIMDSLTLNIAGSRDVAGTVAVLTDLNEDYNSFSSHGIAKLDSTQLSPTTKFRIGSITKTFTAIAILQLVENGQIDLHLPVENYLPILKEIKSSAKAPPFTTHHLLTHTSGLRGEFMNALFIDKKRKSCMPEVLFQDTIFTEPGLIQAYSNLGYGILGCLIEEVSGLSYGDYLKENILSPAGMHNTGLYEELKTDQEMSDGFLTKTSTKDEAYIQDVAAGDLVSTSEDMLRFLNIILNEGEIDGKRVIAKNILQRMQTNQIDDIPLSNGNQFGYGLFFGNMGTKSDEQIGSFKGHSGDTRLFHAVMYYLPKLKIGIVVMNNSENGGSAAGRLSNKIIRNYLTKIKNIDMTEEKSENILLTEEVDLSVDDLKGEYGVGAGKISLKKRGKNRLKAKPDFKSPNFLLKELKPGIYSAKMLLLGFVPIKLKKLRFIFSKHEDDIYWRQGQINKSETSFIGKRRNNFFTAKNWEKYSGDYEVLNATGEKWNIYPTALKVKDNLIYLTLTDPLSSSTQVMTFEPISNNLAEANIIGRGMGEYIKILETGNLFFSGFELKKL